MVDVLPRYLQVAKEAGRLQELVPAQLILAISTAGLAQAVACLEEAVPQTSEQEFQDAHSPD